MARAALNRDPILDSISARRRPSSVRTDWQTPHTGNGLVTASSARRGFVVPALFALVLGILLILSTMTDMGDEAYWIGRNCLLVALIMPQVMALLQPATTVRTWRHLVVPLLCFVILFALYLPRGDESNDNWVPLIQIVLLAGFFASTATWTWTRGSLIVFLWIAQLFVLGSLVGWILLEFPVPFFGYYVNPNANGAVFAYLFGLSMLGVRPRKSLESVVWLCGWLGLTLLAIGTTVARASLLAMFAGMAVYVVWPALCRRRLIFMVAFWVPLTTIGAVTALEAIVIERAHEHGFGALSNDLTGKNLTTRSRVWEPILAAIVERPIWGHGSDIDVTDVVNADLSSHSMYLQVTLQAGFSGLAVLVFLLNRIWTTFWLGRRDPTVRAAGAAMIGMLLHQGFVVSLTQNHVAVGTIVWLILGVGVARSIALDGNRPFKQAATPNRVRWRVAA